MIIIIIYRYRYIYRERERGREREREKEKDLPAFNHHKKYKNDTCEDSTHKHTTANQLINFLTIIIIIIIYTYI